ncbi:hypothetical protein PJ985_16170 [Streptomyces sp. ACA25]|uniref:DNA polymerase Y family protein n=1 Tax=Streptomyces sp. ACA25 TaxID=3022596 RepID=UPI0023075351|nr:hypothetical protein [Streptomyces sp. ACA25]MDB1089098.1 hypothetical protein [Streptomyces sp. ACA25]
MTAGEHHGHVLYVRFDGCSEEVYPALIGLLHGITPVVQPVPRDAAFADVRGSLRYFGCDALQLAQRLRVQALARYGADCTVGVAGNPLLARMAAEDGPPGAVRRVPDEPEAVSGFLAGRPTVALPGAGPATVRTLTHYGLGRIDAVAAAPPATLQRILGAAAGRRIHDLARGIDPTPVTPAALPRSASAEHRFGHDELDPVMRRRALLALADRLGYRLRGEERTARTLTLTVRYADRSVTTRSRSLAESTAHTPELAATAYALHDGLGLQRARVRALTLRAEGLVAARHATRQLSLDPADERRRRAEAAADRARGRFGGGAVGPAAAHPPPGTAGAA